MKRLILAAVAALALTASVSAADSFVIVGEQIAHEQRWDGAYVGVVGLRGTGTVQDVGNKNASAQDTLGLGAGVTAGYNVQFDNNVVVGIEADVIAGGPSVDWEGRSKNQFDPYYGSDTINGTGTIRGRVGYAIGDVLPYVTAGVGIAHTTHTLGCDAALVVATNGCQNRVAKFNDSSSQFVLGGVVGGGVEVAVSDNVSVKAEYLYTAYQNSAVTLTDPNYPAAAGRDFSSANHSVRVGLNVKF